MFTKLTQAGFDALLDVRIGNSLKFTKFVMGRLTNPVDARNELAPQVAGELVVVPNSVNSQAPIGTIVATIDTTITYSNLNFIMPSGQFNMTALYTGDITKTKHTFISDRLTVLKMFVPPEFEYFKVNAVVLYAQTEELAEFPFLISYSLVENPKFSTETNRFGTRYFYMLQLDTPNRDERFDFSNMEEETVDFFEIEHHYNLPIPPMLEYNQLLVNNHTNLQEGNRLLVINSQEQYFGVIMSEFEATGVVAPKADIVLIDS